MKRQMCTVAKRRETTVTDGIKSTSTVVVGKNAEIRRGARVWLARQRDDMAVQGFVQNIKFFNVTLVEKSKK